MLNAAYCLDIMYKQRPVLLIRVNPHSHMVGGVQVIPHLSDVHAKVNKILGSIEEIKYLTILMNRKKIKPGLNIIYVNYSQIEELSDEENSVENLVLYDDHLNDVNRHNLALVRGLVIGVM